MATKLSEVIESFESSFMDKKEIPESLEMMWLKKAISQYGTEIEPLEYDEELGVFYSDVSGYVIDTLAVMIKIYYLERETSRVNKIASVVGKDLSINGTNGLQKYTQEELLTAKADLIERLDNLKPSAYN